MKTFSFLIILISLFSSAFAQQVVKANDDRALGAKLFRAKSCTMCHKKSSNSIGPSVVKIATVYSGKEKQLYRYLKGKSKAIVTPSKAHVMDGQFLKLKGLEKSKLKAIARYIITISDREF